MYYVATYGDLGLVVEFFPDAGLEYQEAVAAAEKAHVEQELDSFTYGECCVSRTCHHP